MLFRSNTIKYFVQFKDVTIDLFLKKLNVLNVVLLINTFMITMATKVNSNVKSVLSHLKRLILRLSQ